MVCPCGVSSVALFTLPAAFATFEALPAPKKKAASKKAPSESEKAAKWDEFQSCFESTSAGTAAYSAFVQEHGKPET